MIIPIVVLIVPNAMHLRNPMERLSIVTVARVKRQHVKVIIISMETVVRKIRQRIVVNMALRAVRPVIWVLPVQPLENVNIPARVDMQVAMVRRRMDVKLNWAVMDLVHAQHVTRGVDSVHVEIISIIRACRCVGNIILQLPRRTALVIVIPRPGWEDSITRIMWRVASQDRLVLWVIITSPAAISSL